MPWPLRLRRIVREQRIDLVHVHSPLTAAIARLALPRGGVPIIYTEHNEWTMYRRPTYWLNALTYHRNARSLAVSNRVAASVRYPRGLRWLPGPRVETHYQGLDRDAFLDGLPPKPFDKGTLGIPPDAPVIGSVAHFRREKGHRYLIAAAKLLQPNLPGFRLVLVGGGPEEASLRAAVRAGGLDQQVIFAGERQDVAHIVSCFDVFVLASLHEGLPVALLEAMASGVPAVVTDAGGNAEVVQHGRQGLVVATHDPVSLAAAIFELLSDPGRRGQMGSAGQRRAAEFDLSRSVSALTTIYREVLQSRCPCHGVG